MWSKITTWWHMRKLAKELEKQEINIPMFLTPEITREAHEIYKLGHLTCTVMSSKEELVGRLTDTKHKASKAVKSRKTNAANQWLSAPGLSLDGVVEEKPMVLTVKREKPE
jgi:hypothetical protein